MKSFFKNIISSIIQFEARIILKKYKPKIIAVTGNVGKTSAKDAIFSVMSSTFYTRKSEKSFNSDIGIPLTILGCNNAWSNPILWFKNIFIGLFVILFKVDYPNWLVLEVGADRPGDIRKITKWLKPDIVVITAFAKVPVHIEFFENRDEIIKEKKYLVQSLKRDGLLIVNGDDEDSLRMKEGVKNKTLIYGTDSLSDLIATNINIQYTENNFVDGMSFKINHKDDSIPISIKGSLGIQNIYSSLSSIAVGFSQGINLVKSGEALLNHEAPKGRMKIISGIKETIIIDDTYNSSPVAVKSALLTIKDIEMTGRKIVVMADMLELGKYSSEEHYEVGSLSGKIADILITVGIRSRKIAEGALSSGMDERKIFQYESSVDAGKFLQEIILKGDVILIKGSQSMRMEKAVLEIMSEPHRAKDLLVRQEEEWQNR